MKEKAFIWILSLIDGYKPVCVDIWPSKVTPFISRFVSSYICHICNLRESTLTTWSTGNAYLIANLLLVELV